MIFSCSWNSFVFFIYFPYYKHTQSTVHFMLEMNRNVHVLIYKIENKKYFKGRLIDMTISIVDIIKNLL